MNTIGWALIITAILLFRSVVHGHVVDENGKFTLLDNLDKSFAGIITGHPAPETASTTGLLAPTPPVDVPRVTDPTASPTAPVAPPANGWATNPKSVTDALSYAEAQRVRGGFLWPRRCLAFVARAYGLLGSGSYSAMSLWNAMPPELRHNSETGIPVGALLFYTTRHPLGHVDLYAGNGQVYSTDILRFGHVDKVAQSEVTNGKWRLHYLGWTPPYFVKNSNSKRVSGD